jgi:hypothetical protein
MKEIVSEKVNAEMDWLVVANGRWKALSKYLNVQRGDHERERKPQQLKS